MKKLQAFRATPEQLPIISNQKLGVEVIRGAAGSGKTSSAILRVKSLLYLLKARRIRLDDDRSIRILILTFNRTLAGYVSSMVAAQLEGSRGAELTTCTFAKWAMNNLPDATIEDDARREATLRQLIDGSGVANLTPEYIMSEVDYVLGRFDPNDLQSYLSAERTGRGISPRVDSSTRGQIIDKIIIPYLAGMSRREVLDWNTLSVAMRSVDSIGYDVIVVDEAQDFSANQLRAIAHHRATESAVAFVIDTAQRIYARGFTWVEAGFDVTQASFYRLAENHRNSAAIARFVAAVMSGVQVDADGSLPQLSTARNEGTPPTMLEGVYSAQVSWAINFLRGVDLERESVAFLAPLGKGWFTYLRQALRQAGVAFVELTRSSDWPESEENVAVCTFHSAKGLEFDHVLILGLSDKNADSGMQGKDDQEEVMRRLFAVACARARDTLIIGYKSGEESYLIQGIDPSLFSLVKV